MRSSYRHQLESIVLVSSELEHKTQSNLKF